ncbi:transposase [Streptomyces vietnamensis]|uniref:transposase n=1 Tax=Streptomyces vietnamensis TaxID=362257 RepID=UPI00099BB4F2|nr:transposase [Streptomyces vietnamensis]
MTTPWTAPTRGHTNDCTQFTTVMEAIRVPRTGPGHPRIRPDHVLGDKGYSSKAIRAWLRPGIPHTIPERAAGAGKRARRSSHRGRPPAFDRAVSKHRNVAERCFNHWKQCRGSATRYYKAAEPYETAVALASLLMGVTFDDRTWVQPEANHAIPERY